MRCCRTLWRRWMRCRLPVSQRLRLINRHEAFGRGFLVFEVQLAANSEKRQNAFASFIWRGALASAANRSGLATTIDTQRPREVATLSRFALNRNSIPLGASA